MKKTRIWLIVLSIIMIASFVLMGIFSKVINEGNAAKDWMGVFALLMTGSFITNLVISFRYAWKTGRRAVFWVIGTILLPYITPIVLALLPIPPMEAETIDEEVNNANEVTSEALNELFSDTVKKLFNSVPEPSAIYKIKIGGGKNTQWELNRLRMVCIILPGTFKWRVVTSSQSMDYFCPDLMTDNDAHALYKILDETSSGANYKAFYGIKICLIDYKNNRTVLDLYKLKNFSRTLLAGLYHFQGTRISNLKQWFSNNPQITLTGGFGGKVVLNKEGYHLKNITIPWKEVGRIDTETINGFITHLYVLPRDYSGGIFDFKKGKYTLKAIPGKEKELYSSECFLWKTYYGS